MKKTKLFGALICAFSVCMGLCACGKGSTEGQQSGEGTNEEGEVKVVWWTSYATTNQGYINDILDDFNEKYDGTYEAELVYTGGNETIRTKLATTKQKDLPALIDGQPIVLEYYASSDAIIPIQNFIDADEDKEWMNGVYDSVKAAYTSKAGKLAGWPLGVSSYGWFVNVDMIKEAGYTLESLTSYEKIAQAASAVYSKNVADYGIAYFDGTELFNAVTLEGCDMVDGDNGYSADATKSVLNEGSTKQALTTFLSTFAKLCEEGSSYTFGADVNGETIPAFVQEKVAIIGATNSYANKIISYSPKFEWAFIPFTSVTDAGTYVGSALVQGHGMFVVNNQSKKVQQGAYELVKFLSQPENQAFWCSNTGYIPYTEEAFAVAEYNDWMMTNFPTSVQLQQTIKATPAELRTPATTLPDALQEACSKMLDGVAIDGNTDFDSVIQKQSDYIDECIEIEALRKK